MGDSKPVDIYELTDQVIDAQRLVQAVSNPSCGAVATFHGITRNHFDGREVVRLEYEAYSGMAEKKMKQIGDEVRKRFPSVVGVAIVHRTGVVPPTEASIVICCSSPHRVQSLEACHFAIDEAKRVVPVWKREVYGDGSAWKQNSEFLSWRFGRKGGQGWSCSLGTAIVCASAVVLFGIKFKNAH
eukprot:Hpha_TRINITY_DN18044_c0_g1::TRINITY_DN18044_c0_g1_i1::g.1226::m.1226/K03635/MOCS2B, moaE; molybdopterin synthase catalytic subunit